MLPKIHDTAAEADKALRDFTHQAVELADRLGIAGFEIKVESIYYVPNDPIRVGLISRFTPSACLPFEKTPSQELKDHLAIRALQARQKAANEIAGVLQTQVDAQRDPGCDLDLNTRLKPVNGNGGLV